MTIEYKSIDKFATIEGWKTDTVDDDGDLIVTWTGQLLLLKSKISKPTCCLLLILILPIMILQSC